VPARGVLRPTKAPGSAGVGLWVKFGDVQNILMFQYAMAERKSAILVPRASRTHSQNTIKGGHLGNRPSVFVRLQSPQSTINLGTNLGTDKPSGAACDG
jgi:hypothetical protein